ncbi:unnamed protein product [Rotaria magnacalcarata]|uniref:Uncharacterized protein n=2 Tax=Rotaria magnacalcarata TaxID=392030 RepID=A0A816LTI7_9BILA|nr:unnamed protein product [Rotaria magnacalcarata]CAF1954779.1 unnamed protein product [Rotaria magnacalcarata]
MLKISNAHRYWAEHRIKNEVYTMQYLIEHATIPISKRIDYSTDFKTHVLSCEYTLMEKIYGNTLESVIEKISDRNLVRTALEMTDYVKQLRQIKLPQENRIGSFSSKQMFLGGSIEDGPTLGPFITVIDYIIEHLRWIRKRIQTDEQLFQMENI